MGNYGVVLSLLGCLENGLKAKKLVDTVIDDCKWMLPVSTQPFATKLSRSTGDIVTNLREDIFVNRLKYSLTTSMAQQHQECQYKRQCLFHFYPPFFF